MSEVYIDVSRYCFIIFYLIHIVKPPRAVVGFALNKIVIIVIIIIYIIYVLLLSQSMSE